MPCFPLSQELVGPREGLEAQVSIRVARLTDRRSVIAPNVPLGPIVRSHRELPLMGDSLTSGSARAPSAQERAKLESERSLTSQSQATEVDDRLMKGEVGDNAAGRETPASV